MNIADEILLPGREDWDEKLEGLQEYARVETLVRSRRLEMVVHPGISNGVSTSP